VAASLSHAYMQEGIAGAIRELHEAEPLLGIVPLDGGADGWTGKPALIKAWRAGLVWPGFRH